MSKIRSLINAISDDVLLKLFEVSQIALNDFDVTATVAEELSMEQSEVIAIGVMSTHLSLCEDPGIASVSDLKRFAQEIKDGLNQAGRQVS
jgi:hypothetical protein